MNKGNVFLVQRNKCAEVIDATISSFCHSREKMELVYKVLERHIYKINLVRESRIEEAEVLERAICCSECEIFGILANNMHVLLSQLGNKIIACARSFPCDDRSVIVLIKEQIGPTSSKGVINAEIERIFFDKFREMRKKIFRYEELITKLPQLRKDNDRISGYPPDSVWGSMGCSGLIVSCFIFGPWVVSWPISWTSRSDGWWKALIDFAVVLANIGINGFLFLILFFDIVFGGYRLISFCLRKTTADERAKLPVDEVEYTDLKRYFDGILCGGDKQYFQYVESKQLGIDDYLAAAEQGCAVAQFNLGWWYANGQGVEKDEKVAVEWYRKAAEQGQQNAIDALKRIEGNDEDIIAEEKNYCGGPIENE